MLKTKFTKETVIGSNGYAIGLLRTPIEGGWTFSCRFNHIVWNLEIWIASSQPEVKG